MGIEFDVSLLTVLLSLIYQSNGYQSGAPQGACQSMTPSHDGNQPQNGAAPYAVSIDQTSYTSGSVVTVTLNSTTAAPFKGYLMQMRRSDNQAIVVGFSVLESGQLLACNSQNNAAVTHTENGDKHIVRFNWTAPAETVGQIRIVATVVQTKPTFWTFIESSLLTEIPSTATEGELPTSTSHGEERTTAPYSEPETTAPDSEPENVAPAQIFNCLLLFGVFLVQFLQ